MTGHPCHPNVSVSGGIPGVFPSHIALIEFAFFSSLLSTLQDTSGCFGGRLFVIRLFACVLYVHTAVTRPRNAINYTTATELTACQMSDSSSHRARVVDHDSAKLDPQVNK